MARSAKMSLPSRREREPALQFPLFPYFPRADSIAFVISADKGSTGDL